MKILVFSDSHGKTDVMRRALLDHGRSVSMIIHLGDGVRDIMHVSSLFPEIPLVSLKGNGESAARDVRVLDERGIRFVCMHGHTFSVKSGIMTAAEYAAELGGDILLYGHTHVPCDRVITLSDGKCIRVFNPGSAGAYRPSYGVICIPKKGVYLSSHAYP